MNGFGECENFKLPSEGSTNIQLFFNIQVFYVKQ